MKPQRMCGSLSLSPPPALYSPLAMLCYNLNSTVYSPGKSTTFVKFSLNGRFLAVGDQGGPSLFILDKITGFHPTISATTPAEPTALVWETSKAFYVGLSDRCFIHYQIECSPLLGLPLMESLKHWCYLWAWRSLHFEEFVQ
jgi:hypothetical protein